MHHAACGQGSQLPCLPALKLFAALQPLKQTPYPALPKSRPTEHNHPVGHMHPIPDAPATSSRRSLVSGARAVRAEPPRLLSFTASEVSCRQEQRGGQPAGWEWRALKKQPGRPATCKLTSSMSDAACTLPAALLAGGRCSMCWCSRLAPSRPLRDVHHRWPSGPHLRERAEALQALQVEGRQ